MKRRRGLRRLKEPAGAARYLTRMLQDDEAANMQGALADVVRAQGGLGKVAARAALSEWRLRLMLWDQEEAWKLVRLAGMLKGMGLKLRVEAEGRPSMDSGQRR